MSLSLIGWFIALLFFAAILLAYSNALNGAFVWDDDQYISKNPMLRTMDGLRQIWLRPTDAGHQYYPLSFTGFWIGWHLWGLHPIGYHLVNICLHTVCSVLFWQILKRLKVPGALLAGALFALHPVNVMSVAWMNEMKNTLSGSLALGAAWCYLRFEGLGVYTRAAAQKRGWGWYAAALALFLLAMCAKTAVSFLPVSLLLVVWWQRDRIGWREIWPLLPAVGIVAGMGLLTIYVEHHTAGATGKDFSLSFAEKLIVSGRSFFFYLGKLFFPVNLTFVYPRWQIDPRDWHQYLYPAAAAALLADLWLWRGRIGKGWFAAAMHFYISTSFLVLMVVLYRMRYSFVSDHWQYFGSLSVFALMGAGLAKGWDVLGGWNWLPARSAAAWLCVSLFVLLGALTWYQCGMFRDLESLWNWSIARNPACWMAENNLGNDLLENGHVNEAIGHLQRAISLKPDYVLAMNNLGKALIEKYRPDEAVIQFQKALAIEPGNVETLFNLGSVSQQQNRLNDAVGYYQQALTINPEFAPAYKYLGDIFQAQGRLDEAIGHYQKAIDIAPVYWEALNNLAYLLASARDGRLRNGAKAVEFARKAIQLSGGRNPVTIDTLAAAYAEEGMFAKAVNADWVAIERAVALHDTVHANLFKKHLELYQAGQPLRDK